MWFRNEQWPFFSERQWCEEVIVPSLIRPVWAVDMDGAPVVALKSIYTALSSRATNAEFVYLDNTLNNLKAKVSPRGIEHILS